MVTVSVLMAVRNGLPYLPEAVESILTQTFRDFEFIIVEDGSTDTTEAALVSFTDRRIRVIKNGKKMGLSSSLNKALSIARGKYVARMDHDDISLPKRLDAQVSYLESHKEVDIVGTWAKTLGLKPNQVWRYPTMDKEIKAEMLFNSALIHSSVMFRREKFVKEGLIYDPRVPRAQDYELWVRAAERVQFANLGQVLLRYRIHKNQAGKQHNRQQQGVAARVRTGLLRKMGLRPVDAQLKLHNALSKWEFPSTRSGLEQMETWFLVLRDVNLRSRRYSLGALNRTLEIRWWAACRQSVSKLGWAAWDIYNVSNLSKSATRGSIEVFRFKSKAWWHQALAGNE